MSKLCVGLMAAGLMVATAGLVGCHSNERSDSNSPAAQGKAGTVWARLGGEENVKKVVHDFVGRAAGDPKVNFFRKGIPGVQEWKPNATQVAMLETRLVELISSGTNGPLKYHGKSMKDSHRGMKITNTEFNALAGHLDAALRAGGAMDADREAVMKFADSTRKDIVEIN
jgi:hemoglobin